MENKNFDIITESGGLVCDNTNCNWEDTTLNCEEKNINMPCPLCGENVLTQNDFDTWTKIKNVMSVLNTMDLSNIDMSKIDLSNVNNDGLISDMIDENNLLNLTIKVHNGVHISIDKEKE